MTPVLYQGGFGHKRRASQLQEDEEGQPASQPGILSSGAFNDATADPNSVSALPGEKTPAGANWSDMLQKFPLDGSGELPPIVTPYVPEGGSSSSTAPETTPTGTLPKPPPSARSKNPFAGDNLSGTLLDIGSAFLSRDNFFEGLGQAGQSINARSQALSKPPPGPKVSYGGPDDAFEIVTNPDGTTAIREVPQFRQAIDARNAAKTAPDGKETVDTRSRIMRAIQTLPEDQRSAAYVDFMNNPGAYGIQDTKGMPDGYLPQYAEVMSGMGQNVNQAINTDLRGQSLEQRRSEASVRASQGAQRISQGERRLNKPPASSLRKPTTKPPAGFILD